MINEANAYQLWSAEGAQWVAGNYKSWEQMENFATPKACSLLAVSCSVQAKQSGRAAARLGQGWTEGRCLLRLWWLQYHQRGTWERAGIPFSLRPRSRRAGAGCVYESVAPAFSVLLAADTWESRQTCAWNKTNKHAPKAPTCKEPLWEQHKLAFQSWAASASLTQGQTPHSRTLTPILGTSLSLGPRRQLLLLTV